MKNEQTTEILLMEVLYFKEKLRGSENLNIYQMTKNTITMLMQELKIKGIMRESILSKNYSA